MRTCLHQHGTFLKGINTPIHARDLNLVRELLGFAKADLLGVSSGRGLMAYADRRAEAALPRNSLAVGQ